MKLIEESKDESSSSTSSGGEAFFVNDGCPVNNFEYLKPLVEGLGYSYPVINLPFWFIMTLAVFQQFLYSLIYQFYPFTPFVTPAEAFKTGITHHFVSKKAYKHFGFEPTRPNDLSQIIQFYRNETKSK